MRVGVDKNLEFVDERFVLIEELGHLQTDEKYCNMSTMARYESGGKLVPLQTSWRYM